VATQKAHNRIPELDSLRGIAALVVVFHHYIGLLITDRRTTHFLGIRYLFPDSLGQNAVIVFFLLSGFVLSMPAVNGKPQPYSVFMIRRIFRIYFPYLAALLLAIFGDYMFHGTITRSPWFNQFWSTPIQWRLVFQHILFLGVYNTNQFDPPFWSLVYEMRISFVFPVFCLFALKLSIKWTIVIAALFSIVTQVIVLAHSSPYIVAFPATLHYAGLFLIGIALARRHKSICEYFDSIPNTDHAVLAALSVILFVYGGILLNGLLSNVPGKDLAVFDDWATAAGAAGFIALSSSSQLFKQYLRWPPIHLLGQISYSLYLLHFIILLAVVHLLYGRTPLLLILAISLPVTILASWIFYKTIELPFMVLGRKLSGKIDYLVKVTPSAEPG